MSEPVNVRRIVAEMVLHRLTPVQVIHPNVDSVFKAACVRIKRKAPIDGRKP